MSKHGVLHPALNVVTGHRGIQFWTVFEPQNDMIKPAYINIVLPSLSFCCILWAIVFCEPSSSAEAAKTVVGKLQLAVAYRTVTDADTQSLCNSQKPNFSTFCECTVLPSKTDDKREFTDKLETASARARIKELLKAIETTAARDQPTSTWPVIRHTGLTLTGRHAHSPPLQPLKQHKKRHYNKKQDQPRLTVSRACHVI